MLSKISLTLVAFLISISAYAHQPDVSTTMLVQQSDKNWILVVKAALTAYEYEINATFGEESFSTPEEFQELVIQHMKNNISIVIDKQNVDIELYEAEIKLGHETNAFFKLKNMPEAFNSVNITNSTFKDIGRNQSALFIVNDEIDKKQFILDNSNNHTVSLSIIDNKLIQSSDSIATEHSHKGIIALTIIGFFILISFGLYLYRVKNSRSRNKLNS